VVGDENERLGLIDVAGLTLEALYGTFDRKPLDESGHEYIFICAGMIFRNGDC
jgi:hypothetical protein